MKFHVEEGHHVEEEVIGDIEERIKKDGVATALKKAAEEHAKEHKEGEDFELTVVEDDDLSQKVGDQKEKHSVDHGAGGGQKSAYSSGGAGAPGGNASQSAYSSGGVSAGGDAGGSMAICNCGAMLPLNQSLEANKPENQVMGAQDTYKKDDEEDSQYKSGTSGSGSQYSSGASTDSPLSKKGTMYAPGGEQL